jgi:hypothetical protein
VVLSNVELPARSIIVMDVSALGHPDARTLERLARLQLAALRAGVRIQLHNASADLVDLVVWAGLADVLPAGAGSGLEPKRLVEEGEELLVDEEVDAGDPTA